jgi:hypothetical protein
VVFSIACARKPGGSLDPQTVIVRARRTRHLQTLQSRFRDLGGAEIMTLPSRDYRYRVIIQKDAWLTALAAIAAEQVSLRRSRKANCYIRRPSRIRWPDAIRPQDNILPHD